MPYYAVVEADGETVSQVWSCSAEFIAMQDFPNFIEIMEEESLAWNNGRTGAKILAGVLTPNESGGYQNPLVDDSFYRRHEQ